MDFKLPDIAGGKVVPPEDPKIARLERIAEAAEHNAMLAHEAAKAAEKDAQRARNEAIISIAVAVMSLIGAALGWFPLF